MRRRVARGALVMVALLGVAGCSVRLDTPPPAVPVADAAEGARQATARESAELVALAGAVSGDHATAAVLDDVQAAAEVHLAALGGVWEPWPSAGPDATAYPTESPSPSAPPATATAGEVLDALATGAAAARDAAYATPGELGQLLGSVAISRTFAAVDLAAALGEPVPDLPAAPLPAPAEYLDAATVQVMDAARYAFEVVAAQSSGPQRESAVERAGELGVLAATPVPGEDLREVAYDVTDALSSAPEGTTPQRHLAAQAELDVMTALLALLGSTDTPLPSAQDVLAAATYAAGQARSWDATLPALPGLA